MGVVEGRQNCAPTLVAGGLIADRNCEVNSGFCGPGSRKLPALALIAPCGGSSGSLKAAAVAADAVAATAPHAARYSRTQFQCPGWCFQICPWHDLWIFQGKEPGPLSDNQQAVSGGGLPPNPFTSSLTGATPHRRKESGILQIADSTTFKVSNTVAAALETIKPGGIREMHWHPNADEWQYYIKGEARMTVFDAGPRPDDGLPSRRRRSREAQPRPLRAEHRNDRLQFIAVFKAPAYAERSLSNWLTRTPAAMVAQHLNIDPAVLAQFPKSASGIVPA
jgi:oxalate decarboxylase